MGFTHTLLFGVLALRRRVLINPQLQFALAIGAAAMHVCDRLNSVYMAGLESAPGTLVRKMPPPQKKTLEGVISINRCQRV